MRRFAFSICVLASPLILLGGADVPAEFRSCYWVYRSILNVIGRLEPAPPEFTPSFDELKIASVTPTGKMVIGKRFIEVCRSFGADSLNAMALVIGHELAHHYSKHFWTTEFGSAYADLAWGQKIDAHFEDLKQMGVLETQADEFGLFYGFVAGYDPFGIAARLYPALYGAFGLNEKMKGYPSMQERIAIAEKSEARIQRLAPVFTAGNLLLVMASAEEGAYRQYLLRRAGKCFEHIVSEGFTSREIYNNLGVCRLEEAMGYYKPEDLKFLFPTVADAESRLFKPEDELLASSKGGDATEELISRLLDDAVAFFRETLSQDKEYIPGYINLACALTLQGEHSEAKLNAERAIKKAREVDHGMLFALAHEISGIIAARQGDDKQARIMFHVAGDQGSPLSQANLLALTGKGKYQQKQALELDFGEEETVLGLSMYDLYRETINEITTENIYKLRGESRVIFRQQETGQVFVIECEESKCPFNDLVLFRTNDDYPHRSSRGVGIGDPLEQVNAMYETADRLFTFSNHTYHLFKKGGIMFKVNADRMVTGWVVFYYKSSY